jgi:hypothetical protein
MKYLSLICLLCLQFQLSAQEVNFKAEISTDSILIGSFLEVRFIIENGAGDFEEPSFDGFEIVSGPNTSSSFNMTNGKVSQKASYTFVITPVKEGLIYIDPASFKTGDKIMETEPLSLMVYPNPAGIEEHKLFGKENENFDNFFFRQGKPPVKKKKFDQKKRKI